MTRDEALTKLGKMVDFEVDPTLSSDELGSLLDEARLAALWDELGDEDGDISPFVGLMIMPTVRNGHRYRLIRLTDDGLPGEEEPDFPLSRDATISDGDLVWQEDGKDYDLRWDFNRAACAGWTLKAGLAAQSYRAVVDGQQLDRNHVIDNCLAMASRYESVGLA